MSYLTSNYTYGRGVSTIKRSNQMMQNSSSRPIVHSIKKDNYPYDRESALTKSTNPYSYGAYNYNDYNMSSSIKQKLTDNRTNNFRINEPKKSSTYLSSLKEEEERKYQPDSYKDSYPKKTDDYRIRVERDPYSSKSVGLVGLNNIGNTCFMNSTLQCLFNLPEFNDYFLAEKHLKERNSGARVATAYGNLIKTMRTTSYKSETPSELKNAVASKKHRFQGYAQQDAQQFLAGLLELLSIDLNRSSKPKYKQLTADTKKQTLEQIVYFASQYVQSEEWWQYNRQRQDSIVTDYFSGQLLSRVVCSRCNNESIAFDNTWDYALNFNRYDDGDIQTMIAGFLKEEKISSDYYCNKCKSLRECKRKIDFFRLPKILVFELKRFSYGKYRKLKLNNRVKVKASLDLSQFITESNHKSTKDPVYDLVGIVNHAGDIDFGHYTAECRNPGNKKWYNFNDSSVYEGKQKANFQSANPYLLFYAKREIC